MAAPSAPRMGRKRTHTGKEKSQKVVLPRPPKRARDAVGANEYSPAAPAKFSSSKSAPVKPQSTEKSEPASKKQKLARPPPEPNRPNTLAPQPSKTANPQRAKQKKLPRLPDHVTIRKRPIHHPAPPTPYSSSNSPKTLYLTASSPFIPTIKRIRKLLHEIARREAQSCAANPRRRQQQPLEANGRLKSEDVEREIVEASREKGERKAVGGGAGEEVFVKATGRAIERALAVGVYFQGENDIRVRVEMGSVRAVDDIELKRGSGRGHEAVDDDGGRNEGGETEARKWKDEDIPETRIRTLSSITVAIRLK